MSRIPDYCGCCGRQMTGKTIDVKASQPNSLWCVDCVEHLGTAGLAWDRTYSATHNGEPCPYQIGKGPGQKP